MAVELKFLIILLMISLSSSSPLPAHSKTPAPDVNWWCNQTPYPEPCKHFLTHINPPYFMLKCKPDIQKLTAESALEREVMAESNTKTLGHKCPNYQDAAARGSGGAGPDLIHVRRGVYRGNLEIGSKMIRNIIMLAGDDMKFTDRKSVGGGSTTFNSATVDELQTSEGKHTYCKMAKLFQSFLAAIFSFALISGCLGATCQLDIGETCPAGNSSPCVEICRNYMGDVFKYAQCVEAPFHKDYYHCRCFYKCNGSATQQHA